jgi:NIPSNAP
MAPMKISHLFSFVAGVVLMLGISMVGSKAQAPNHVYELRMYQPNPGKLDAVIARFRDHTDAIFKRHNIKPIGYWVPEDRPNSKNLFIYMVEHPSRAEADKNWAAFIEDPAWKKARAESEANGVLVNDEFITRYFLNPTTFSPLK